jgi:hypothetical protein
VRTKTAAVFLIGLGILLAGCSTPELTIPEGVQTVHGYVKSVPFSLQRRGTHAILTASGGSLLFYAESTAVNLRSLEGREADLQGIFEKNSDPKALPVLVVSKIIGGEEELKAWSIPALSLSLKLPHSWKGTLKGGSATFTATGFTVPVLLITQKAAAAKSSQPLYGPLPLPASGTASETFVVGIRKASAERSALAWTVRIASATAQGPETVFTFALKASESDKQIESYKKILRTVEFTAGKSSSAAAASSTISRPSASSFGNGSSTSRAQGEGAACGGAAGILCPAGLYCKITDPLSDSGTCTKRGT